MLFSPSARALMFVAHVMLDASLCWIPRSMYPLPTSYLLLTTIPLIRTLIPVLMCVECSLLNEVLRIAVGSNWTRYLYNFPLLVVKNHMIYHYPFWFLGIIHVLIFTCYLLGVSSPYIYIYIYTAQKPWLLTVSGVWR